MGIFGFSLIPVAHAGSISDAPGVSSLLRNVLDFLLSIAGIAGIIALVAAGAIYLSAAGDMRRTALARRAALAAIIGFAAIIGAWAIIGQIAAFFS